MICEENEEYFSSEISNKLNKINLLQTKCIALSTKYEKLSEKYSPESMMVRLKLIPNIYSLI